MTFPCSGCGACCRVAYLIPDWPTRSDGACIHLTASNDCAIYATRPEVCRVDRCRPEGMTEAEYHLLTARICNALQVEAGIGEGYRVTPNTPASEREHD